MRWWGGVALGVGALALGGCLPRGPLTLREAPELVSRRFQPFTPEPALPTASPHGPVTPASPLGRPDKMPFLLVIDFQGGFTPGVTETLRSATTGETITDRASEEGYGAARRFAELKPGRYLMRLTSAPTKDLALAERSVDVPSELSEHATFGWMKIEVPATRSYDIQRTLGIKLTQLPSERPIFAGALEEFAAPGKAGEKVPLTLLLPSGSYRWELADLQKVPDIGYVNTASGKAPVIAGNEFNLDPGKTPGFTLDLRPLIRIGY